MILNIEGATAYSCLENFSGAKCKKLYHVTLLNDIPYKKVCHWHRFQPHHPMFIPTNEFIWYCLLTVAWVLCTWNSTMIVFFFVPGVFFLSFGFGSILPALGIMLLVMFFFEGNGMALENRHFILSSSSWRRDKVWSLPHIWVHWCMEDKRFLFYIRYYVLCVSKQDRTRQIWVNQLRT